MNTKAASTPITHTPITHPPLTTASVNQWFKSTLADPTRKSHLKRDWVTLLLSELAATPEQKESFQSLPAADAKELQAAIAQVVDQGGTIHLERPSETGPGKLVVQPAIAGGEAALAGGQGTIASGPVPGFTLGIFHCTFDANFRNWHCHWGPG